MVLILSTSVLATSFISGIFGMAGGMVLMGILLLLLSVEQAMVIHGVAQFASNGSPMDGGPYSGGGTSRGACSTATPWVRCSSSPPCSGCRWP
jgi:hypothetical protein